MSARGYPTLDALALQRAEYARTLLIDEDAFDLVRLSPDAPRSSIARGASSMALALVELEHGWGEVDSRFRLGDVARRWQNLSRRCFEEEPASAFYGSPREHGVNNGPAGIAWVDACLADLCGERQGRLRALREFFTFWQTLALDAWSSDLQCGLAGFAEAAADGLLRFHDLAPEEKAILDSVGRSSAEELLRRLGSEDSRWLEHDRVGLAVGYAGWVYGALRWFPENDQVWSAIHRIARMVQRDDDFPYWPLSFGTSTSHSMAQSWCNGSPGILMLMNRAVGLGGEEWVKEAARDAVIGTAAAASSATSLCCGTLGQAVALHAYAQCTGTDELDEFILELACVPVTEESSHQEGYPTSKFGIFIGVSGTAVATAYLAGRRVNLPVGFAS